MKDLSPMMNHFNFRKYFFGFGNWEWLKVYMTSVTGEAFVHIIKNPRHFLEFRCTVALEIPSKQ